MHVYCRYTKFEYLKMAGKGGRTFFNAVFDRNKLEPSHAAHFEADMSGYIFVYRSRRFCHVFREKLAK